MARPLLGHLRQMLLLPSTPSQDTMAFKQRDGRPEFISFLAPYLCLPTTDSFSYLGECSFYEFPKHRGWMLHYHESHDIPKDVRPYRDRLPRIPQDLVQSRPYSALTLQCYRIESGGNMAPLQDEISFLQEWPFFSVLFNVSSICGLSIDIAKEFLVEADTPGHKLHVSTAALNGLEHRWLESARSQVSTEEFQSRMHQLRLLVNYIASFYYSSDDHGGIDARGMLNYPQYKILLTIQTILRVVVRTLKASGVFSDEEVRALGFSALYLPFSAEDLCDVARTELLQQGWCQSEVAMLSTITREQGEYLFFATPLDRPRTTHDGCSIVRCLTSKIDETTYQTAHVTAECTCSHTKVNVDDLVTVLEKGEIPIVLISDDLELSIVSGCPFIAISHVWSHGLGNPFQNSLPICQIRRLRDHVSHLCINYPELNIATENNSYAVWIDTLCIPVARHLASYRTKAIHLLGRTFTDTTVLVLDRELEALDSRQTSVLEQSLRICCSGWMRRLWTLQEGMLSGELFIQLNHVAVRLTRPLQINLDDGPMFDQTSNGFLTIRYKHLISAMQYRLTSKMQDEPLILATLMGLDVGEILAAPDRMAQFHILMRKLPADLIFVDLHGKTLQHPPFQWAPSTLLESEIQDFAKYTEYPLAECDEDGLHVVYGGFIFTTDVVEGEKRPSGLVQKVFSIRDRRQGNRYRLTLKQKSAGSVEWPQQPALIVNRDVALLVDIIEDDWVQNEGSYAVQGEATVTVVAYAEFESLDGDKRLAEDEIPEFEGDFLRSWRSWCITRKAASNKGYKTPMRPRTHMYFGNQPKAPDGYCWIDHEFLS
ncbi:hypothetical protein PT974_00970 [Cladobotryum mycophilum]|uniref:Heterokaryon incompatibility domain-containing protein n=1 Tax=Cladobotryum mycophilum TaxID=491253 RepID=A0ABR0T2M2_9HYPO